jgi:hypothetical protein
MQKFLNKMSPQEIDKVMSILKDDFSNLLMDTYGNYFCQKLIQTCTSEQRINLLNYVLYNNVRLCLTLQRYVRIIQEHMRYNHLLKYRI